MQLEMSIWETRVWIFHRLSAECEAPGRSRFLCQRFPDVKFIGAFNKLALLEGSEGIDREFQRLMPVIRQGGYIPGLDHQAAPDTRLETIDIISENWKRQWKKQEQTGRAPAFFMQKSQFSIAAKLWGWNSDRLFEFSAEAGSVQISYRKADDIYREVCSEQKFFCFFQSEVPEKIGKILVQFFL